MKGMSGGPVLFRDENRGWEAIGLHTHKGLISCWSSGVSFTE